MLTQFQLWKNSASVHTYFGLGCSNPRKKFRVPGNFYPVNKNVSSCHPSHQNRSPHMRPVSAEQAQFDQPRNIMMLDDAEMALQLSELAPDAPAPAQKRPVVTAKRVPAPPMQYNDFL